MVSASCFAAHNMNMYNYTINSAVFSKRGKDPSRNDLPLLSSLFPMPLNGGQSFDLPASNMTCPYLAEYWPLDKQLSIRRSTSPHKNLSWWIRPPVWDEAVQEYFWAAHAKHWSSNFVPSIKLNFNRIFSKYYCRAVMGPSVICSPCCSLFLVMRSGTDVISKEGTGVCLQ